MLMAYFNTSEPTNHIWLLDSGANNHMIAIINLFNDLDRSITTQDVLGRGELVKIKGRGTVHVKNYMGSFFIRNVMYVL